MRLNAFASSAMGTSRMLRHGDAGLQRCRRHRHADHYQPDRLLVVSDPLAWTLAFRSGLEVTGVFWSIPTAELLITLMGLAMFMRGRWKLQKI